jgi:hypothetical protein
VSDKNEGPDAGGWVPSAEHPVPPTTEFQAISPDEAAPEGPEPISAPASDIESISVPAPEAEPAPTEPAAAPITSHEIVTPTPADDAAARARAEPDHLPPTGTPDFAVPAPGPASETPVPPVTPSPADPGPSAAPEPPAWKTPDAAGLPPQWGDPDAVADAAGTGPQPSGGVETLWGLAPEDRPEVALGAALAGGVLAAILVRTLARR